MADIKKKSSVSVNVRELIMITAYSSPETDTAIRAVITDRAAGASEGNGLILQT